MQYRVSYVEISPVRPFVTYLWLIRQIFVKFVYTNFLQKNVFTKCHENRINDCDTSLRGVNGISADTLHIIFIVSACIF